MTQPWFIVELTLVIQHLFDPPWSLTPCLTWSHAHTCLLAFSYVTLSSLPTHCNLTPTTIDALIHLLTQCLTHILLLPLWYCHILHLTQWPSNYESVQTLLVAHAHPVFVVHQMTAEVNEASICDWHVTGMWHLVTSPIRANNAWQNGWFSVGMDAWETDVIRRYLRMAISKPTPDPECR